MLQIHNEKTDLPTPQELDSLVQAFASDHYVRLQQLVHSQLREAIGRLIDPDAFEERLTPEIGCVQCCTDARVENGLQAMFNQPAVLQTIGQIVREPVHLWGGNTVRRVPGKNHFSNWHNDESPPVVAADGTRYQRVVPLSLNLSSGQFEGGNLEIRRVDTGQIIADVPNNEPGDAILFRINGQLQHRVADVTGGVPRMVHVGWFHRRLDQ